MQEARAWCSLCIGVSANISLMMVYTSWYLAETEVMDGVFFLFPSPKSTSFRGILFACGNQIRFSGRFIAYEPLSGSGY